MKYKIVITQIDENVPFKDKEYKSLGKDENGENQYQYTYFDSTKEVSTDIFDQTIEDLDLGAVIKAINKF